MVCLKALPRYFIYAFLIFSITAVFLSITSCRPVLLDEHMQEPPPSNLDGIVVNVEEESLGQPAYLSLYEGLHVTGIPIDVDIDKYRLRITGYVEDETELTYEEVKTLDPERIYSVLDCPGYFVDEGYWTGVKVSDLLEIAGLRKQASRVSFISIDGSYRQEILLNEALDDKMLISYEFNDKEFSSVHGFPLRLVADGKPGNYWVKWLGEIELLP